VVALSKKTLKKDQSVEKMVNDIFTYFN